MARELNTLSVGFLAPHFAYVPYRINQAGTGTATIELEYRGIQVAHTDTIEIVIYPPGDPSFISEAIDYAATWTPQHRCRPPLPIVAKRWEEAAWLGGLLLFPLIALH
jgi:hypothetical protein